MVEVRRMHLGTEDEHTVYEAEIVGAILALDLISEVKKPRSATIGVDNQAVIQAVTNTKSGSGSYLLDIFHELFDSRGTEQNSPAQRLRTCNKTAVRPTPPLNIPLYSNRHRIN